MNYCTTQVKTLTNQKGKLKTIFLVSNHGRTQKNEFLTMVRQEKPNPIGYKFKFTHLNRVCLVLPWLDARRNHLKFPLLKLILNIILALVITERHYCLFMLILVLTGNLGRFLFASDHGKTEHYRF